jgi:glycosyltransferase involved in cell wall biosynthesis
MQNAEGGRTADPVTKKLSVIMPAYNEAPNLSITVPETLKALDEITADHELIVVDDGSTDESSHTLQTLRDDHPNLRVVRHRRNLGKSRALTSGFEVSCGSIVILMDADGQDDPAEIGRLVATLDTGADLVTGRRAQRHDRFIKRRTSQVYNWMTARVTRVDGRDFNSGLKAMRREVVDSLNLYGELHRYIPILASWEGFDVTEVDVEHHPRMHGKSKFGVARFWRGMFDLVTVKFLTTYTARPFHLFGGLGFLVGLVGIALLVWMAILKVLGHGISDRPALLIGILFVVVAVQLMSIGLIGELIVYHREKRQRQAVTTVRE